MQGHFLNEITREIDRAERAVVLLSGGLDSATVLAMARAEGREVYALSFDYGQRHRQEVDAARRLARSGGAIEHLIIPIDLRPFGGSALTGDLAVPKDALGGSSIPVTYVPARNTIFLAIAVGYAETRAAREIWLGVNAVDFSGYPDCRPEFIEAFQKVIFTGTRSGVEQGYPRVRTPLMKMSKAEIITAGTALGVDYSATRSCYDPDPSGAACGHCDSCLLRKEGFEAAGVPDPTRYRR
jgi:7-cyano-7-deazaguanine synthase